MSKVSYGARWGRIRKTDRPAGPGTAKTPEEVVRELKKGQAGAGGEQYREKALALTGLICAHCGREFDSSTRHLLTIHHKDGNHQNNPPDGSNWEALCVYCHENIHSRDLLGDYMDGRESGREESVTYRSGPSEGWNVLGNRLKKILKDR